MRIPLRRLPCGYHTLRITQSLPDANLYSKLPHAFQQFLDLFCYFLYFLFQSDQFPAVHLFFLRHFQSMYRLNQKYSRLGLKLFRQMCLFQTVSKAFQILSCRPQILIHMKPSVAHPCTTLTSHTVIRFLAFGCIQCHLYIHQAGQCLFSCHCSFIQFFFYSFAAHTFLSLRHASFAANGWQFMFGIQESKDKKKTPIMTSATIKVLRSHLIRMFLNIG